MAEIFKAIEKAPVGEVALSLKQATESWVVVALVDDHGRQKGTNIMQFRRLENGIEVQLGQGGLPPEVHADENGKIVIF